MKVITDAVTNANAIFGLEIVNTIVTFFSLPNLDKQVWVGLYVSAPERIELCSRPSVL